MCYDVLNDGSTEGDTVKPLKVWFGRHPRNGSIVMCVLVLGVYGVGILAVPLPRP